MSGGARAFDAAAAVPLPWEGALPAGFGIVLRLVGGEHREAYKRARKDSVALHRRWQPTPRAPVGSDEEFDRQLRDANTEHTQRVLSFAAGGSEVLGQLFLQVVRPGPPLTAYAGYWVSGAHAGRGVTTRALALLLDHAFGNLGLHRVEVAIQPTNAASLAIARRLGFEEEGLARRLVPIDGEWRDHVRFSLLAAEWPDRRCAVEPSLRELARGDGEVGAVDQA